MPKLFHLTGLLFLLLLALILTMSFANATSWGSVSNVTKGSQFVSAKFSWGWPNETNNQVICSSAGGCIVTVGPWDPTTTDNNNIGGGINNPAGVQQTITVASGATAIDAWNKWTNKYGSTGSYNQAMWVISKNLSQTCFGFQSFAGTGSSNRVGTLIPGGVCGVVPPVNVECNLTAPTDINLGTIHAGETKSSTDQLTLNCSDPASVTITSTLMSGNKGIESEMLINGSSPATINASSGNNSLTLQSSLTANSQATPGNKQQIYLLSLNIN